jgi:spore coat polysaccharide biosynthesis protein SpsF
MKSAILITARLKSTRLPKKVMKPILGRPMIGHMLDRLRLAQMVDEIILCTSGVPEDDPLAEFAGVEGIACYRGEPDDVLLRLTNAAQIHNLDYVINCTADNPFVDPIYIDRLLNWHLEQRNDYSTSEGLPLGVYAFALSYPAMVRACQIKDAIDTEVWGGYFTSTGLFKSGIMPVTDPAVRAPELRLTVDTPEDFALVTRIFEALYKKQQVFSLEQIVAWCRAHPEAVALNKHIKQKTPKPIRVKADFQDD